MKINMIAAMNKNRVIGNNGTIPWHLPRDLKYFKTLTQGQPVIMGRATYESIGRPLPNRHNIVITRQSGHLWPNVTCCKGLMEAVDIAKKNLPKDSAIWIVGGEQVYREAFSLDLHALYLTVIEQDVQGDRYFPYQLDELMQQGWYISKQECFQTDEQHAYPHCFYQLTRR
ncbi:MAG: dihydrofolate reductase [Pseudomonadota bacterium]|nr:dihydrofolate reductase [Pseudomonadota bacterium]